MKKTLFSVQIFLSVFVIMAYIDLPKAGLKFLFWFVLFVAVSIHNMRVELSKKRLRVK